MAKYLSLCFQSGTYSSLVKKFPSDVISFGTLRYDGISAKNVAVSKRLVHWTSET
jgi:hypothetical protein